MASILTTSDIDSMISSYVNTETTRLITPVTTKKSWYQSLSTAYGTLSSKLSSLRDLLDNFRQTGNDSIFAYKSAASSNTAFVDASAANNAAAGSYNLRASQLAKNDLLVSQESTSSTANSITGTHIFTIKNGDGKGGEYSGNVEVTFTDSETNESVMEKIRDAINSDKASVTSNVKSASVSYGGGTSTFQIDVNGTVKSITVNGGGTYGDLMDELISKISAQVPGVSAEKIIDPNNPDNISLKFTGNDASSYVSISQVSGFDIVSDLNISLNKEKGTSGMVTASAFSPISGKTQFSLSSKETGVDFRITSLMDDSSSNALNSIGLNLGSSRPVFDQSTSPDTSGYVYADITENTLLNSRITFNGLNFQRNSNVISDIADGVTFSLKSVMQVTDQDVNVSVGNDDSSIKSKIEDFITKFNDVYTNIKSQNSYGSEKRGVFSGDSNASSILSMLSSITYSDIPGIPAGNLKMLSQLGISFNSTTGLSISDSSKLDEQLKNNISQVETLFNSTNGIATSLYDKINPYLGASGYLAAGQSRFDSNVKMLSDKNSAYQKRIDKSAELLRNRYEQLQAQLASLLTVQNMFSA